MDWIATFKAHLEQKLDDARTSLIFQNALQPFFYTYVNGAVKEMRVTLDDEKKDKEVTAIQEACKSDGVKCAALLCDMYSKDFKTVEESEAIKDKDLSVMEGTTQNIVIFLYTREGTWYRTIPYEKFAEQDYWFGDSGWENLTNKEVDGQFANPFLV